MEKLMKGASVTPPLNTFGREDIFVIWCHRIEYRPWSYEVHAERIHHPAATWKRQQKIWQSGSFFLSMTWKISQTKMIKCCSFYSSTRWQWYKKLLCPRILTHWGLKKMFSILRTTVLNAFTKRDFLWKFELNLTEACFSDPTDNTLLKGLRMVGRALWRSEARRVVPWSETLHEP